MKLKYLNGLANTRPYESRIQNDCRSLFCEKQSNEPEQLHTSDCCFIVVQSPDWNWYKTVLYKLIGI